MTFTCRKTQKCERCGKCCHIRHKLDISASEEGKIKKKVYETSCVVYLYPFSKYTISLNEKEKKKLEKIAKSKKLKLKILPKKIIFDGKKAYVYDWFIDHDICVFLKDKNICTVYKDRPLICKMFPKIESEQFKEVKEFIKKHKMKPMKCSYKKLVALAKKKLRVEGFEDNL